MDERDIPAIQLLVRIRTALPQCDDAWFILYHAAEYLLGRSTYKRCDYGSSVAEV